jgi:ribosomal peptide maturation radical SAM protein 1
VIVIPPFAAIDYPAIGPSILASACNAQGILVQLYYANFDFAAIVGAETYRKICGSPLALLLGDAIFSKAAFRGEKAIGALLASKLGEEFGDRELKYKERQLTDDEFTDCIQKIPKFLQIACDKILAFTPRVVGFSSVFVQNLASIALAERVKRRSPKTVTILGGANACAPMGSAILKLGNWFDFIFSGEADNELAIFLTKFRDHGTLPESRLIDCAPITNLDLSARPNFSDYFEQLRIFQREELLPKNLPSCIPFETSRGCWWGTTRHCTFCGLNGKEMGYRAKPALQVISELTNLAECYPGVPLYATDNIMPQKFKKEVLPKLATLRDKLALDIFFEVKSNLRVEDLDSMYLAGIRNIQPGIESFSSHVLQRMDKGVRGIQNLWLLRACAERNICVTWNILYGIPGERKDDYEAMIRLFPHINHLQPPSSCIKITIDRFSPYHDRPTQYGITNVRPFSMYELIYPAEAPINDLAYHFLGDYETPFLCDEEFRSKFVSEVQDWISGWKREASALSGLRMTDGRIYIEDHRGSAPQDFILSSDVAVALEYISLPRVMLNVSPALVPLINSLLERKLAVQHEGFVLNVVPIWSE